MNSTASFEIVPFGTSSEGEAEEIRGWGRPAAPRRYSPAFRLHQPPAPGNWRRPAYDHRHHGVGHGHVHGRIHHPGPPGLFAHRLVRDFRRRIGLHRPFGPERPPFFGVGGPAFGGGAPDAPPPGPDAGAAPPGLDTGTPPQMAPTAMATPAIASTGGGSGPEEQIRWIQSVLNTALGTSLPTDGVPSADLRNALQTFQSQHGLPVSGFAGPDTIAALQSASAGQAPGAAGAAQPDAPPAPPAAGGDAPGGEFEIMPAFGAPGSWRTRHRARF